MPAFTTPPVVPYLSNTDFTLGQDAWTKMVQTGTSDALNQAFAMTNGGTTVRIGGFSFPIASIKQLLSAVAVRFIQVRFVLLPPALEQFAIVLYATDKDGTPLTAYYGPGTPTPVAQPVASGSEAGSDYDLAIPPVLANDWTAAWQNTVPLTQPLFLSDNQSLQGYSFDVTLFLRALSAADGSSDQLLLLGVHEYYGPDYNGTPTAKFGVMLSTPIAAAGAAVAGRLYLDMAMPCPPY